MRELIIYKYKNINNINNKMSNKIIKNYYKKDL